MTRLGVLRKDVAASFDLLAKMDMYRNGDYVDKATSSVLNSPSVPVWRSQLDAACKSDEIQAPTGRRMMWSLG